MKKFLLAILMALCANAALANGNGNGPPPFNVPEVNASQTAVINAEQNNSIVLGAPGAPGLAGSGVDCSVISKSYSVLFWSYGKSVCEEGSAVWRDVAYVSYYQVQLGMSEEDVAAYVTERVCAHKPYAKLLRASACPKPVRSPYREPKHMAESRH